MERIEGAKEKERKEMIFQVDGINIIIVTSKISSPEVIIRKSETKKSVGGKEEWLARGVFILNLPALQEIKNKIGEKATEDLLRLSFEQIKPDLVSNMIRVVEETIAKRKKVEEKIEEKKEVPSKEKKIFNLLEIFSNIKSLIDNALRSTILNEESKKRVREFASKLEEKIEIKPEDKEVLASMIEVLKEFLILSNLQKISLETGSVLGNLIGKNYIEKDNLSKVLNKIKEGKRGEALSILINIIAKCYRKKKLEIEPKIFSSYINPSVAITADEIIRKLSSSPQAVDTLLNFLEKWREKK